MWFTIVTRLDKKFTGVVLVETQRRHSRVVHAKLRGPALLVDEF